MRSRERIVAGAILAVLLPAGLAAQEPERPDSVRGDVATEAPSPAAPSSPAPTAPPRLGLSLTVGSLGFGELQTQPVRGDRGEADTDGDLWLRRTLSATGGYHVQAAALLSLTSAWAVRIGGGIGRAELDVAYSGASDDVLEEVRALPAGSGGTLELLNVEAALRFRIPTIRRFAPYIELGGAREWWSLDEGEGPVVVGVEGLLEPLPRTAVHLGAGATAPLTAWLDGRIQATARYVRTPFAPGAADAFVAGNDSLRLTLAPPAAAPFADGAVELARVLRLEAGVTIRVGRVAAEARPRPAGSAAAPSGTRP